MLCNGWVERRGRICRVGRVTRQGWQRGFGFLNKGSSDEGIEITLPSEKQGIDYIFWKFAHKEDGKRMGKSFLVK